MNSSKLVQLKITKKPLTKNFQDDWRLKGLCSQPIWHQTAVRRLVVSLIDRKGDTVHHLVPSRLTVALIDEFSISQPNHRRQWISTRWGAFERHLLSEQHHIARLVALYQRGPRWAEDVDGGSGSQWHRQTRLLHLTPVLHVGLGVQHQTALYGEQCVPGVGE